MHKINVLAFGSSTFNISLEELKEYFNFKLTISSEKLTHHSIEKFDVLILHQDCLQDKVIASFLENIDKIKILVSTSNKQKIENTIVLPTSISEINMIVENSIVKKDFSKNSSIKIKNYILDKNEKKLIKGKIYIQLTEKEIQLLELFLKEKLAVNKDKILREVWQYATDADTHTVETHIYRLRKKIKSHFLDESFILNNKSGYLL